MLPLPLLPCLRFGVQVVVGARKEEEVVGTVVFPLVPDMAVRRCLPIRKLVTPGNEVADVDGAADITALAMTPEERRALENEMLNKKRQVTGKS